MRIVNETSAVFAVSLTGNEKSAISKMFQVLSGIATVSVNRISLLHEGSSKNTSKPRRQDVLSDPFIMVFPVFLFPGVPVPLIFTFRCIKSVQDVIFKQVL